MRPAATTRHPANICKPQSLCTSLSAGTEVKAVAWPQCAATGRAGPSRAAPGRTRPRALRPVFKRRCCATAAPSVPWAAAAHTSAAERCASRRRCDSSNVLAATARALRHGWTAPLTGALNPATRPDCRRHQPRCALCRWNGEAGHRRDGPLSSALAAARIRASLPPPECCIAALYCSAAAAMHTCAVVLPRRCTSGGVVARPTRQLLARSPGAQLCCDIAAICNSALCALKRWAVRTAQSVEQPRTGGAAVARGPRHAHCSSRGVTICGTCSQPVSSAWYNPQSAGVRSRPQLFRSACHQQRPARRAHNRLQEALHIVRGGVLHHAGILRVVRNEARHPGAPPAAPLMLLVDRPSYARDAPKAAVGTRRVCASAGSPCERRGGEQVHVRSASVQRRALYAAASRECALSRRYAP